MQHKRRRSRGAAVALVLLAVALAALGGASATSAKPQAAGEPDTYVASWDAVAAQAYTAAGLTAGGRSRDLRVPGDRGVRHGHGRRGGLRALHSRRGRSRRRLGGGGRRRRGARHSPPLPAGPGRNRRGCLPGLTRDHPGRAGGDERCCGRFCSRRSRHRSAIRRRVPGARDLHTAEPTDPGRLAAHRPDAPDRDLPRRDDAVRTRLGGSVPAGRPARPRYQEVGARLQRGEGGRVKHEHEPDRPSRPWQRGSGRRRRCNRHTARSASSSRTTGSTLSMRRGSWRWCR